MLIPMRPDPAPDPAVEAMEEPTNVGAFVILAPTPQEWVKPRNQLLGFQRDGPLGLLPYLAHETMDRLLFGICIQHSLSHLATNLALGKIKLCLPTPDFCSRGTRSRAGREQSAFSADVTPRPAVSGFGRQPPPRRVPLLPIYR